MKCLEVEQQIDSLLDGELSSFFKKEFERHLESCNSCCEHFEKLQKIRGLLKNNLTVTPSSGLDARVLTAFQQHQNNQPKKDKSNGTWSAIFGQLVIPKPVFALSLLTLAVLTVLAFQLGRMSAPNNQSPLSSPTETAGKSENNSSFNENKENIQTKIVEVPVTRFIKIPVIKEKIVTRVIYKTKQVNNQFTSKSQTDNSNNFAQINSNDKNNFLTPINLKVYQPVSVLKIKIIPKGENNED